MLAVSRSDSLSDPSDFCTRGVETVEDIFCLIYLYTDLLLLLSILFSYKHLAFFKSQDNLLENLRWL
jgi:hypothetical protein